MCGIAGWLSANAVVDPAILRAMTYALAHRGPDAAGFHVEGRVSLGHRRLAVIDIAETANQPMADIDGELVLVFNGEIYNFASLKVELEDLGHRFRTRSDSEVILEAYKRYGAACVTRLNGMFAFAIWDRRRRTLFLARDRAGEKPLFYARNDAGFGFASEPRALRQHPSVGRGVDAGSLAKFLAFGYVTGPGTLHPGIFKLPPGCTMTVREGAAPVIERYWSLAPHYVRPHGFSDRREAEEALRALIDDATRLRMIADVPLGAFLSSGVDSATIVAAMKPRTGDVRTFSIGFDRGGFDESADARVTALALGASHADRTLDLDLPAMISAIVHAADEPIADNSALPMWLLARFAREHVTVALSGDGGDELFGGYETYLADLAAKPLARLPGAFWSGVAGLADRILPVSFGKVSWDYKARHFLSGLAHGWPEAHYSWRTIFSAKAQAALLKPTTAAPVLAADPYADFAVAYAEAGAAHFLDRAMLVDLRTWMADDVLVKVDRMSMAHALEVRAPFLDHRIMELAASLPPDWKVGWGRTKTILRESQRGRLPDAVLTRRKLGFNAPMSHWLLGPLRDFAGYRLSSPCLDDWFNRREIDRLWVEHQSRRRDNSFKIFALLTLSIWLEG